MDSAAPPRPILRCDDCGQEFELFSDLARVIRCVDGRPHRAVRVQRAA